MSLTSASTRDDALAQYRTNLAYESDSTGTSAREFVAACRYLLTLPVRTRGAGASEVQYDPTAMRQQLSRAEQFLQGITSSNPQTTPQSVPRQFSMERFEK